MKITKQLRLAIVTTVILGVMSSCQQNEEVKPLDQEKQSFLSGSDLKNMIKLGKELENPYSVENMRKAYENLSISYPNGRTSATEDIITTTHLYIRFKPRNEAELSILHQDTTLILYTYPLHYEIAQKGNFYHDPRVPLNQPTYQYCAVKVDKKLPRGVAYDLIARLFIPDEDSNSDENLGNGRLESDGIPIDALVDEALRITGNLDEEATDNPNGRIERSKWRPAGKILLEDDILGKVPLTGAKVRARRWFTTHQGITNANGDFSCDGRFKRDANYSIKWERNDFDIRSGSLGQALYNGPKKRGDWNLTISSRASRMYAIVHQALNDYYYGNRLGLKSPPQNSFWKARLKVSVRNEPNPDSNGNHNASRRFLGISSWIRIWNNGGTSREIYGTAIHEIAHASHWELRRNTWDITETKVKESWARGVQWAIGRLRYPGYEGGATIRPNYTQVVVDMIDNRAPLDALGNPINHNKGSENLTEDDVSGYTIKQIEDVLSYTPTWEYWKTNIKNKYTNATEGNLDALFTYWN